MTKDRGSVNSGFVLLRNVAACGQVLEHLVNRSTNLPGIGVFSGASGLGKSSAAAYCANKFNAVYVECRSYFTAKSLLQTMCKEMRIGRPGATVYDMVLQIGQELSLSRRAVILDEADHIVNRRLIELIRDLYEASNAPVLLIGEEMFPAKLKRWERFHNRVLEWCDAERSDLGDAQKLSRLYSPEVDIADDLLGEIVTQSAGVARRICVNIDQVRVHGMSIGAKRVDMKGWAKRGFYTGEAPTRRVA